VELMPHSYTNHTTRDGMVVTKSFLGPDASRRCAREADVLSALAGLVPVPPVLGRSGTRLRLGLMSGVHGQELIDAGRAGPVLRACGQMLRRIHAIDPKQARAGDKRDDSAVLVHGDYGPNNVLLDAAAVEVIAVVDWEWAHAGDRVEDLAWCEWIVRMHHPRHVGALSSLFDAYGSSPAWTTRQEAMVAQCRALLALCERWEPGGEGVSLWQHRLQVTESWAE
jgi:aminoglycoside phosphotransferase (APT) family kinase protein